MLLQIDIRETGYRRKPIIKNIRFALGEGEIAGIIGPNGAGKSTLLKAIVGLIKVWDGTVRLNDVQVQNRSPAMNVRSGMAYVPQGNRVFDELTVAENLLAGGHLLKDARLLRERVGEAFELFPELSEKRKMLAGRLSGGQKQMLALGRALMLRPQIILMDEPSLGLSPKSLQLALQTIRRISKERAVALLVIEQKVHALLEIADTAHALKLGEMVFSGLPADLLNSEQKQREIFLV